MRTSKTVYNFRVYEYTNLRYSDPKFNRGRGDDFYNAFEVAILRGDFK